MMMCKEEFNFLLGTVSLLYTYLYYSYNFLKWFYPNSILLIVHRGASSDRT